MASHQQKAQIKDRANALIIEAPLLHDWGNGPTQGGLEGDIAREIAGYVIDEFGPGEFTSIETGAGLSTLIFMTCEPLLHVAINPDQKTQV